MAQIKEFTCKAGDVGSIPGLGRSPGEENDKMRILFGEVPGVLIQINSSDYDYVDSQLLLQDIAYYPIGHPSVSHNGIKIHENAKTGVADILASLLEQASEGED